MDLTRIPRVAIEWLSDMCRRDAAATSTYVDDLSPVPPGVDPLGWRIAQGHFRPDVPKRRLQTLGPDDFEVRWRG